MKPGKSIPQVPSLRFSEFNGEWGEEKLGNISTKVGSGSTPRGGREVYLQSGVTFIRSQNVNNNLLELDDVVYISDETHSSMKNSEVLPNDILINITGASLGRSCVVPSVFSTGNVNQHVCIIRLKKDYFPHFLQLQLASYEGQKKILRAQAGGGREGLNFVSLRGLKFRLPSLPEQEKIASFLSDVDAKIENLTQQKACMQQYKKGCMQKLFSQEIRFKDDDGNAFPDWEEKKLGEVVVDYKHVSNIQDEYEVLTSSHSGLVRQSDYFGTGRITEKDNIGFNIVPEGYITYRSRSDNRRFTFNINSLGVTGIVSTYYPVFTTSKCNSTFIVLMLNYLRHYIGKHSVGTSQTVLSLAELKRIKLILPTHTEQNKIANFLSSIDDKIEALDKQLEAMKEFKKGLLQGMFV